MSDSLWPHGLQHARPPCPSPTPGACSNSCPSGWWCHPTISSVIPFSSCLQSFPASGSFPMSQLKKIISFLRIVVRCRTLFGLACARWLAGVLATIVQVMKKLSRKLENVNSSSRTPFLYFCGAKVSNTGNKKCPRSAMSKELMMMNWLR